MSYVTEQLCMMAFVLQLCLGTAATITTNILQRNSPSIPQIPSIPLLDIEIFLLFCCVGYCNQIDLSFSGEKGNLLNIES